MQKRPFIGASVFRFINPNLSARSLVTQKSYTIGVIFEEVAGVGLQHPLFSKILESFRTVVEAAGYDMLFLSKLHISHIQKSVHDFYQDRFP